MTRPALIEAATKRVLDIRHARDILELTNSELCVLRWLRISNGKATMTMSAIAGNGLFVVPDRLTKAQYVETQTDRSNPKTRHYTLTEIGREALALNESNSFFSDLTKRRRGHRDPATA
jgi:hypothetical protein